MVSPGLRGAAPLPDAVFDAVAGMIEAVTVDAASDELLAAEFQRGQCIGAAEQELLRLRGDRAAPARDARVLEGAAADVADQPTLQRLLSLTPNLKLIVRDVTHASRRVTAKPEAADEHLEELTRRLFVDKHSITQIIQHSDVWRREFACFVERQEDGSGGRVINVRAAQHRHESKAKPRGRFVLNLDAFLQTALLIVADRHGQEVRKDAIAFLRDLTVEDAVQVAMLADAADEALLFTRQLDDENVDPGQLSAIVERFLTALRVLFLEGKCVDLPGFTSHMLGQLQKPRSFQPAPTLPARTFGGPGAISSDLVERCLARMQKYARLAAEVTRAEFPNFDILSAYRVFHLEAPELRLRGGCAALARHDLTDQQRGDLQRLAKFSDKDAANVAAHYLAHYPIAMAHKVAAQCDNGTAWRFAIDALSRKHHCSIEKHPAADFIHVAMRYLCFGVSTAAIEQSFSALKRLFGEQGLHGSDASEEQMARVLLSPVPEPSEQALFQRGQAPPPLLAYPAWVRPGPGAGFDGPHSIIAC